MAKNNFKSYKKYKVYNNKKHSKQTLYISALVAIALIIIALALTVLLFPNLKKADKNVNSSVENLSNAELTPQNLSDIPLPVVFPDKDIPLEHFEQAIFIGDDFVNGISDYLISPRFSPQIIYAPDMMSPDFTDISSKALLKDNPPADGYYIYIIIGRNEQNLSADKFAQLYQLYINSVKDVFPVKKIYLQSPVPYPVDGVNDYNEKMLLFSNIMHFLANENDVEFLDIRGLFSSENEGLLPEVSPDGVNLIGEYYLVWLDFITHNI